MRSLLILIGFSFAQLLHAAEVSPRVEGYFLKVDQAQLTAEFTTELNSAEVKHVAMSVGDGAIGWQGRRISCSLVESEGKLRAEKVMSADPEELRQATEITEALRRDTFERGRVVTRGANELMPIMALWGQDGKFYLKKDFLGAPLVVNFVFTRCGNPKMCPAATQSMKKLGDALAANTQLKGVKLLTITFDPTYDTPGVLRMYADSYQIDGQLHHFLTGDKNQVKDLMRHYGILTTEADGTIVHNSATLIVSPEGRIVQRREGSTFDPNDVIATLKQLVETTKK
jgi:protein SCO1/2